MTQLTLSRAKWAAGLAMVLSLALLLGACAQPNPTATPTPTPVPTSTPTPVPDPLIRIDANSTWADLVELLPSATVDCLRSEMGSGLQAFLTRSIFDTSVNVSVDDVPLSCFTPDAMVSVFVATLSQAANGLSGNTITCIRETFQGLDVDSLRQLASGDLDDAGNVLGIGIGLLLCLTDDEAERITAGSFLGDLGGLSAISLKDIRCVFQSVDLRQISSLIEALDSNATPDFTQMLGLLDAFSACGIDINDLMVEQPTGDGGIGDGSTGGGTGGGFDLSTFDLSQIDQLPPELQEGVRCLIEAVGGVENAQGFLDGTYAPEFNQLIAASQCPIDLNAL